MRIPPCQAGTYHKLESNIHLMTVIFSRAEAETQAETNIHGIDGLSGGKQDLRHGFLNATEAPLPARAKLNRLKKAAEAISKAVVPHSACKTGCSFCCHISVGICESEAKAISKATGRSFSVPVDEPSIIMRERWHMTPCPFLSAGRCSIYEDRPIACRLNFNMADTPEQCDTQIPSEDSYVMFLNLQRLDKAFLGAFFDEKWADIRDFFPPK